VTDHKEQPLSATTFEPAPAKAESVDSGPEGGQPRLVVVALAAAAVLLIFVFFVLPQLVTPDGVAPSLTDLEQAASYSDIVAPGSVSNDSGNERSPFAEAQESALRRDAQEVLQSLLTLQESLAGRGAARWGEPTYGEALGHATAGDTAYRGRDFTGATAEYQLGLDQLLELEASLPERIEALYYTLVSAIENGDVLTAQARFSELAEMTPADIRLIALEDRLAALPAVIAALETAAEREASGTLGAAVEAATDATLADPTHQRAAARLSELLTALTRQQFTDAMTAGYGAMGAKAFDSAEQQFGSAAKLIPSAPEPGAALIELEQARTQNTLLGLREQGTQAEREERWADASDLYQQALEIDALMLFATEGVARAEPRADLGTRLETMPKERGRLIDARIMRLAQETLAEAEAIADPGPRLQAQIAAARDTLAYASTPVAVTMTSDGLTDITLLRVRRLGTLAEQTLSLRPGVYTAVGIRSGYRDVRIKFEVQPDKQSTVEVRCVETI
jgi:tetratricopeptide (TPR) repeat protein